MKNNHSYVNMQQMRLYPMLAQSDKKSDAKCVGACKRNRGYFF